MKPAKLSIGFVCLLLYTLVACSESSAVNAVGYINVTLKPGFNLISNPLASSRDTVSEFFDPAISSVNYPSGLTVFLYRNGAYQKTTYDATAYSFDPPGPAAEPVNPGEAFWVYNPSLTDLTVTFAGEVLQGTLINPLEYGYSLVGSIVPRSGTLSQLEYPHAPGDLVYVWDATNQTFRCSLYDDLINDWLPAEPRLETAQGFIVWKNAPTDWIQIFRINQ